MMDVRAQTIIALAAASLLLVGCVIVREKDPCAGDACDPIPLPARDIDGTESIDPPPRTKAAPLGDGGSGSATGGTSSTNDAGTDSGVAPAKGSGVACDDRDECSAFEYCCFFPAGGPKCALQSECASAQTFYVCESDIDCPIPLRCIAQTSTGHRACF
jgi:hypothetical protein